MSKKRKPGKQPRGTQARVGKKFRLRSVRGFRTLREMVFLGVVIALMGSGTVLALSLPQARVLTPYNVMYPSDLRKQYAAVVKQVGQLEDRQTKQNTRLVSDQQLQNMISNIQLDAADGNFAAAMQDIATLQTAVHNWNLELNGGEGLASATMAPLPGSDGSSTGGSTAYHIPILIYHYTPPDFDEQLDYLQQHNYTVVDMDAVSSGLNGGVLPAKPVVITFDDGFENQMTAFNLLQKHQMKATFYIINGGERSQWCIGASRRYNDPVQPPGGCGDAYLNWDQVRQLDRSGLITIGGHTVDHENLATLLEEDQRFEISASKAEIEKQIGHPIRHFAYPYGAYNATTIQLVHDAGYVTAVTTLDGQYQSPGMDYTLRRVRDARDLP